MALVYELGTSSLYVMTVCDPNGNSVKSLAYMWGRDGIIQVADLKTFSHITTRLVVRLYTFELGLEDGSTSDDSANSQESVTNGPRGEHQCPLQTFGSLKLKLNNFEFQVSL